MKIFRSIKWRIILLQAIVIATVLSIGVAVQYSSYKENALRLREQGIQRSLNVAFNHVLPIEKGGQSRLSMTKRTQNILKMFRGESTRASVHQNKRFYVIWNRDKQIIAKSKLAPDWISYPQLHHVRNTPEKSYIITSEENDYYIQTDFDDDGYAATVGHSTVKFNKTCRNYALKLIAIALAIFLALLLLNYWIISREHRPIQAISKTARSIGEEGKRTTIDLGKTSIELQSLATSLNLSYQKLDTQIQTQKQFTNDVAHELRTPIAVVKMANNRISKHTDSALDEVIHLQQSNIQHMEQMVEKMLQLSSLQSSQNTLEISTFSIAEKIDHVVSSLQLIEVYQNIELTTDCPPELELRSDSTSVIQILTNLLENALKYARSAVSLTVSKTGADYRFIIADDGEGIPPASLPHLFERFYRVDKARSLHDGGVGLGLAIVAEIVTQLEGQISVDSEEGKGTTFTLTLTDLTF